MPDRIAAVFLTLATLALPCHSEEPHPDQSRTEDGVWSVFLHMDDVRAIRRPLYGCRPTDDFAMIFDATDPEGEAVEGLLCCGHMDACSVEWL